MHLAFLYGFIIWRIFRQVKHFGGKSAKMYNDMKTVADNIKSLRKSKNLTQSELGKILGYSARTVSDWEKGNTEPNITAIKSIVKYFDITYEEFFSDD